VAIASLRECTVSVLQLHGKSVNTTEIGSIMAGVYTVRAMYMLVFPTFLRGSFSSHSLLHSRRVSRSFPSAFLSSLGLSISWIFWKSNQSRSSLSNIAISCLGQERFVIDLIQHNHDAKPSSTGCCYSKPEISYPDLRYIQNSILPWRYRVEKSHTPASLSLT
jgi:hypothetical protein